MKYIITAIIIFFTFVLFAQNPNVTVFPGEYYLIDNNQINPGKYHVYKIILNRGTELNAIFDVNGGLDNSIKIWLLDYENYLLFQNGQRFRYYKGTSGQVAKNAKYKFITPSSGEYFIVLDNSSSFLLTREVNITLFGIPKQKTNKNIELENMLQGIYSGLKEGFEFKDFNIMVKFLGEENAFSMSDTGDITLSQEILVESLNQGVPGNIMFVLFHELGHSLLNLWGLPMSDNEDAADEFATVLLLMLRQKQMAMDSAQYWYNKTSKQEALSKLWQDDRHTISPQRARNIINWTNNETPLLYRWQKVLVPHMKRPALEDLLRQDFPWVDKQLVRAAIQKK